MVQPSQDISENTEHIRLIKWENNIIMYFCTETDIRFTRVSLYINLRLNDSFSPLNHISSLTFFSDFDTVFNTQ